MNWGNKLLLTFVVFGAGMTFLVYRSVKTNYELVDKEYYKSELAYQQVIDGSNRANALSETTLTQDSNGIILQLPAEMKNKKVSGTIHFYCAYDEKLDKRVELTPSADGQQVFAPGVLQAGTYTVKINWQSEGTGYYTEKNLIIP
ncbi:MAG: FixH family protein [Bacteroidetes bacterium]|nr:FixH family protein [Bacteroidota bacterium]